MATMTATPHQIVPLHLSGNTTEQQNRMLQDFLGEAVQEAYKAAIEQLDRQSAQSVLDMDKKLKHEVAERVVEIIQRHHATVNRALICHHENRQSGFGQFANRTDRIRDELKFIPAFDVIFTVLVNNAVTI